MQGVRSCKSYVMCHSFVWLALASEAVGGCKIATTEAKLSVRTIELQLTSFFNAKSNDRFETSSPFTRMRNVGYRRSMTVDNGLGKPPSTGFSATSREGDGSSGAESKVLIALCHVDELTSANSARSGSLFTVTSKLRTCQ